MTAAVLRSREAGVAGVMALTALVVGMVDPAFLGMANLGDIAVAAAPALIVACGMTLVLVMGEIDLSVGALMGLCAAVLGRLVSADHAALPVWAAASLVLVLGAGIGALNGLLVTVGRVPSIIATLGTGTAGPAPPSPASPTW
jgi:ribose/xylose/arabinose/galactoside ABC-type transport system permease subunit